MKQLAWSLLVVLACLAPAHAAGEHRAWVKEIPNLETWKRYSKTVGSDEFAKAVIDVKTNEIYYIDVNLFNIHADFVLGVLLKQPWTAANVR